jgi:hypothetical protein
MGLCPGVDLGVYHRPRDQPHRIINTPNRTLNAAMLTNPSTPSSHMSNTRVSNVRAITSPFGRFLVDCPSTNIDASFFCAQNSNEDASSNGRTSFFFENEIAWGFLSATCPTHVEQHTHTRTTHARRTSSFMACCTTSPACVPRTNIAVRASSTSFGSRASKALFERAFRGFLACESQTPSVTPNQKKNHSHRAQHGVPLRYALQIFAIALCTCLSQIEPK